MPNATVMLIEHPERFGLSQLHQLRGRVGRGAEESLLHPARRREPGRAERLQLFARTDDGFEIARADLRLRGMGDLFGERQSGEQTFRYADPIRDEALNLLAMESAEEMLRDDPALEKREHAAVRTALAESFPRALALFRVG